MLPRRLPDYDRPLTTRLVLLSSFALAVLACGENPAPPPARPARPEPPLVIPPFDAGGDATAAKPIAKSDPARPPLTCPTPSVASAVQSCASTTGAAPSIAQVFDAQAKLSAKAPKRPLPHKRPPDAERLAPRPLDIDEQTFLHLARGYVCNTKGGANANRDAIAYAEARQYFEAQHWEEAGTLFHDIAVGEPSDVAIYAAQLSLEAFNVLATKFNRLDCNETLAVHVDEYIARLCTRTDVNNGEQCKMLKTVKDDLQKLRR